MALGKKCAGIQFNFGTMDMSFVQHCDEIEYIHYTIKLLINFTNVEMLYLEKCCLQKQFHMSNVIPEAEEFDPKLDLEGCDRTKMASVSSVVTTLRFFVSFARHSNLYSPVLVI